MARIKCLCCGEVKTVHRNRMVFYEDNGRPYFCGECRKRHWGEWKESKSFRNVIVW